MARPLPHRHSLIASRCCELLPDSTTVHPPSRAGERLGAATSCDAGSCQAQPRPDYLAWHVQNRVAMHSLPRQNQSNNAGTTGGIMAVPEGDHGGGPAEEWSLSSHSPGQEPWILGLEELLRLQRATRNDDGLTSELALIENETSSAPHCGRFGPAQNLTGSRGARLLRGPRTATQG